MCGIVGYTGMRPAASLVLEGLKRLEYRGYDSAGLAVLTDRGQLDVFKAPGKITALEKVIGVRLPASHTALAHTRWAAHGAPTEANAHPHTDCGGLLALVHNGSLENAGPLRTTLTQCGHRFRSETDTVTRVDWDGSTIERGGHAHFMLKEILEPESLRNALRGRLLEEEGDVRVGGLNIPDEELLKITRIVITGCDVDQPRHLAKSVTVE